MSTFIGGLFPVRKNTCRANVSLPFLAGHAMHFMSGRCGIVYALRDYKRRREESEPTVSLNAYLPAYTCETVLHSFLKEGLDVSFYRVDRELRPHFDSDVLQKTDVLLLSGYYGYQSYEEGFLDERRVEVSELLSVPKREAAVVIDLTHTLFNQEPLPVRWDYAVGSLRKWMGIYSGGFACKKDQWTEGVVRPCDSRHILLRKKALELAEARALAVRPEEEKRLKKACDEAFWEGELFLRQIFDAYGSDEESLDILRCTDFEFIRRQRIRNAQFLMDSIHAFSDGLFPAGWRPFALTLPPGACPSHFTIFADERDRMARFLSEHGIGSSVYWPLLEPLQGGLREQTKEITEHILSLPCDQRCGDEEMARIADCLRQYGN